MNKTIVGLVITFLGLCCFGSADAVEKGVMDKTGEVARAQFTTAVNNREPVDQVVVLPNTVADVYFFTEVKHMAGQTIIHRWKYNDKVVSEKRLSIGGPRWRAYSKGTLDPGKLGKWTVVVTDGSGWPLKAAIFEYVDEQEYAMYQRRPMNEPVSETANPVVEPSTVANIVQ
jgi:hypothetical protein